MDRSGPRRVGRSSLPGRNGVDPARTLGSAADEREDGPQISDRRAFVKRAGLAALGGAAVAPVVGSARAGAAGTQPAYTDAPNVFTADQRINAGLGINADAA